MQLPTNASARSRGDQRAGSRGTIRNQARYHFGELNNAHAANEGCQIRRGIFSTIPRATTGFPLAAKNANRPITGGGSKRIGHSSTHGIGAIKRGKSTVPTTPAIGRGTGKKTGSTCDAGGSGIPDCYPVKKHGAQGTNRNAAPPSFSANTGDDNARGREQAGWTISLLTGGRTGFALSAGFQSRSRAPIGTMSDHCRRAASINKGMWRRFTPAAIPSRATARCDGLETD